MTERDERLDIEHEAAAGGGPELVPATDEHATEPSERGWDNPQTQDAGAAAGAADGSPTPGEQVEPTAEGDDRLWPNAQPD